MVHELHSIVHNKSILNKVVEGMNISIVCELVAVEGKLLQAMKHNTREIAIKLKQYLESM